MGMMAEEYRLPLMPMEAKNKQALRGTMKAAGLIG